MSTQSDDSPAHLKSRVSRVVALALPAPRIRAVVQSWVGDPGIRFIHAADADALLHDLAIVIPDAIVLDLSFASESPKSLVTSIRRCCDSPVMAVCDVLGDPACEIGADRLLELPLAPHTFAREVASLLKRREAQLCSRWMVGPIQVDLNAQTVRRDGRPLNCAPREFELLRYLVMHADRVVGSAEIMTNVWGAFEESRSSATIHVHIHRLREKIEADPARPQALTTVRGVGYQLRTAHPYDAELNEVTALVNGR